MMSPHAVCVPPQDLLRAVSGTIVFFITALVALAASRDALAATTFVSVLSVPPQPRPPPHAPPPASPGPAPPFAPPQTFSLILSFLFAFDAFVTYRTEVAPAVGRGESTGSFGWGWGEGQAPDTGVPWGWGRGRRRTRGPLLRRLVRPLSLSLPEPDMDSA